MKVHFEEIRLDPGAFSPSGVFEYPLSTPINFQSGDILGVWQPRQQDSVVRIFYSDNDNSAPINYRLDDATNINDVYNIDSSGFSTRQDEFILISPVAGIHACMSSYVWLSIAKMPYMQLNCCIIQILHVLVGFSAVKNCKIKHIK